MYNKVFEEYEELLNRKQQVFNDKDKIISVIEDLDKKKKTAVNEAWAEITKNLSQIFSKLLPNCDAKVAGINNEQDIENGVELKVI